MGAFHDSVTLNMNVRKALALFVAVLAVALALLGCGPRGQTGAAPPAAPSQPPVALRVWLPCGLSAYTSNFDKLLAGGGVKPEYEIVNLWDLEQRLRNAQTKPDLIIMPGDQELQGLFRKRLLAKEPVAWAFNQLAVLTPQANPCSLKKLADLTKTTELLLSPPSTSTGYYAQEALKKAGLFDKLKKQIVISRTPAEIYQLLADGKAQAAVAYAGCAFPASPDEGGKKAGAQQAKLPDQAPKPPKQRKVIVLGPVPEEYAPVFPAMAGIPAGALHAAAAETALQALLSDAAQAEVADFMPRPARQGKLTSQRVELRIYCGAGMRPPVERVARMFEQTHPNTRVSISYAGSGCLLAQLTFSRRGDLYLPGETFYLNQARDGGFLTETQHIAYFVPVILVAKGNPKGVKGIADLLRPDLHVAIGQPDACAVGRVTKVIYDRAGLWSKLEARQPRQALNVPELAYWVAIGAADAAMVWQAQARQFKDNCDSLPVPANLYDPVDISVGLLKFVKHADLAREFMRAVASPESRAIFKEEGYTLQPGKTP